MKALIVIRLIMGGCPVELGFVPFGETYNWVLTRESVKHELRLDFRASLSIFLMTPKIWAITTAAFLNEPHPLGNYLPGGYAKRAYQMFLTWFGFPKNDEELKSFQPTAWQTRLLNDHTHAPEEVTHLCGFCGIFCPSDICSSDEEDVEELCICGRKPEKCKCKKCKICKLKPAFCECVICEDCKRCRCDADSAHREVHSKAKYTCKCEYCDDCGEKKCCCSDSSDSVLY